MATATKARPAVTSWSFTRLNDYRECPAKFAYKHLDKITEPPSAAMERGTAIHSLSENYLKGSLKTLPTELGSLAEEFKALKAQKQKVVEETWAFTATWGITQWNDWKNCWLRVKLDVAYFNTKHMALVPIDVKTGKCRDEEHAKYTEQLELYSLAGLIKFPEAKVVSPRLWYVDHGIVYPDPEEHEIEYTQADLPKLKKAWEKKVVPMFKDKAFKPTPSDQACKWCPYKKANSGPCKY